MQNVGPCGLCGYTLPLRNSHIIPEFVERRLKADSGTPYFRGAEPNRRTQSSKKMWLLCDACEQRFSLFESEFAKTFYHPTLDGGMFDTVWTDELANFLASLTWRNLIVSLREHRNDPGADWKPSDWAAMESAEQRLRMLLLGRTAYPADIEHHIFRAGANAQSGWEGANTILNMAMFCATPATDEAVYSIVVIPSVVIVALIEATADVRALWRGGTLAEPGLVVRNYRQSINDGSVGYYIVRLGEDHAAQRMLVSARQRAIIAKAAAENQTVKEADSRIAHALLQDERNRRSQ